MKKRGLRLMSWMSSVTPSSLMILRGISERTYEPSESRYPGWISWVNGRAADLLVPLEHADGEAGPGQVAGGNQPIVSAADNHDIVGIGWHSAVLSRPVSTVPVPGSLPIRTDPRNLAPEPEVADTVWD